MIYAYDNIDPLPIRDLYNSNIMLAAINAAKDQYDTARQDLKDFKKEYGDFYSPISSDNDWYFNNVTGKVQKEIDRLYSAGIDPLRSAEGRTAVRNVINSINTGAIANKKRAALAAEQYVKSRDALIKANMFNPEYERQMLGGQSFEEWDGSLGDWKATSASPYLDYEQKYGHLFDKMGYEYDPEESKKHPGMMVSTKNKARMHDILSASRPDLVNDPQYKYDLQNLVTSLAKQNPNMSQADIDALAVRTLENEIVERNYKGGMQMQEDPIAREQRDFQHKLALQQQAQKFQAALQQKEHENTLEEIAAKYGQGGGGYSATTNLASDAEGLFRGQLQLFDTKGSVAAIDNQSEAIKKALMHEIANPNKNSAKKISYLSKRLSEIPNRRISAGMEGVADEVIKLANKKPGFIGSVHDKVNGLHKILLDLSSQGSMDTINALLKNFATMSDDGGFNLGRSYDRLTGIGAVMEDVLSRGYNDGKKHSKIDTAINHLKGSGSLSKFRNTWTSSIFDSRNYTDDIFPDRKVYPTGNVVAGDKYYYIEVSNDATDTDESVWFKIERDKMSNGGINPVLSSITQQVDDEFLHKYSHTNVLGNQQSVVQKFNE